MNHNNKNLNVILISIFLITLGLGIVNIAWAGLCDELILNYPFDSNTEDKIGKWSIGEVKNLSFSEDRFGIKNNACEFKNQETDRWSWKDPAQSYLKIPAQEMLKFQGPFSFSVWLFFNPKIPSSFSFTSDDFNAAIMNEGVLKDVPEDIRNKLEIFKDKTYNNENEFLDSLKTVLNEKEIEIFNLVKAAIKTDHTDSHIIAKKITTTESEAANSYNLWITQDNTLTFEYGQSIAYDLFPEKKWVYVTAVFDGSAIHLYIDGAKEAFAKIDNLPNYDENPVYIGADNQDADLEPEEGWTGYMDDLRIYNRALSDLEILELFYADKREKDSIRISGGDFRMVSFVHWPDNHAAFKVFGDDISDGYDPTIYKIGIYDANIGNYREYDNFNVVPGNAYWVYAKNDFNLTVSGIPVNKNFTFDIELDTNGDGWNMIGCPNNTEYYWDNLEVVILDDSDQIIETHTISDPENIYIYSQCLWKWSGGTYLYYTPGIPKFISYKYDYRDEVGVLKPREGYWVKVNTETINSNEKINLRFSSKSIKLSSYSAENKATADNQKIESDVYPPEPLAYYNNDNLIIEDSGGCFVNNLISSLSSLKNYVKIVFAFIFISAILINIRKSIY